MAFAPDALSSVGGYPGGDYKGGQLFAKRRCRPPAVAAGFWGAPVAGVDAAEPSAATPRSRQLSEQVPPRRSEKLVALDDPNTTSRCGEC
jgi:hypothetical protein